MVIHKQKVNTYGSNTILVPRGAKFLTVQLQHADPVVWYTCDPTRVCDTYEIQGFTTGSPVVTPDDAEYLGTIQYDNGNFVKHFFVWKKY